MGLAAPIQPSAVARVVRQLLLGCRPFLSLRGFFHCLLFYHPYGRDQAASIDINPILIPGREEIDRGPRDMNGYEKIK